MQQRLALRIVNRGKFADQYGMFDHLVATLETALDGATVLIDPTTRIGVALFECHAIVVSGNAISASQFEYQIACLRLAFIPGKRSCHDQPGAMLVGERIIGAGIGFHPFPKSQLLPQRLSSGGRRLAQPARQQRQYRYKQTALKYGPIEGSVI